MRGGTGCKPKAPTSNSSLQCCCGKPGLRKWCPAAASAGTIGRSQCESEVACVKRLRGDTSRPRRRSAKGSCWYPRGVLRGSVQRHPMVAKAWWGVWLHLFAAACNANLAQQRCGLRRRPVESAPARAHTPPALCPCTCVGKDVRGLQDDVWCLDGWLRAKARARRRPHACAQSRAQIETLFSR